MYNITLPLISLLNVHVIESISKWNFSYNPFKILSSFKYTATEDEILIGFHVDDCEYCQEMKTLLRRLELEEGIRVHILDASMPKNLKLLKRLDNGKCGGLPFYYNVKTNRYICGATAYENLLVWATNGVNKTHMPPRNSEIEEHKKYRSLGLMCRLIRWLNESLDVDVKK